MAKPYPWRLLPRLALAIELGRGESAHRDLGVLLRIITITSGRDLPLRKLRTAQLLNICLRGAHAGGAPTEQLLRQNLEALKTLMRLPTWSGVRRYLHAYTDELMIGSRRNLRSHMDQVVQRIRRDLLTPAGMSRPLAEFASLHHVSTSHLSRSFRSIVGRTFREELRRVRIEAACRLLRATSWKVSAIAAEIGMSDPSQFIANFRADIGVTPSVYRGQRGGGRRASR